MMVIKDAVEITSENAEILAINARNSLSDYCQYECEAHCCRGGYLLLSAEEVALMPGINILTLNVMPLRSSTDTKRFIFNLGISGCPNLSNSQCMIHKNSGRPKVCGDYPLFIDVDKTLVVASDCPGVNDNKLFSYLHEFKVMGYKLVYSGKKKVDV